MYLYTQAHSLLCENQVNISMLNEKERRMKQQLRVWFYYSDRLLSQLLTIIDLLFQVL